MHYILVIEQRNGERKMLGSQDIETIMAIRRAVRRAWCECATEMRPYSALFQPTLKALLRT